MLCYVMLCYVMLCYVMLCYVMLCYVMLCYTTQRNVTQHNNRNVNTLNLAYTDFLNTKASIMTMQPTQATSKLPLNRQEIRRIYLISSVSVNICRLV